jgi:hypothetical protein
MNKKVYQAAFNIQKVQNALLNKLSEIGLSFEYGNGAFGQAMSDLTNESDMIIKEALGLHYEEISIVCKICGINYPATINVLYTEANDPEWSITEDDFCQFLYEAATNDELQEFMWRAMVEKDEDAKAALNATKKLKIGTTDIISTQF